MPITETIKDRVREITNKTGNGDTFTLAGATGADVQTFAAAFTSGQAITVFVTDNDSAWECFDATFTGGNVVRTTQTASSTGAKINWAAGEKHIVATPTAAFWDRVIAEIAAKAPSASPTFTGTVTVAGGFVPDANNSRDLGTTVLRFRNGWFADTLVSSFVNTGTITASGTIASSGLTIGDAGGYPYLSAASTGIIFGKSGTAFNLFVSATTSGRVGLGNNSQLGWSSSSDPSGTQDISLGRNSAGLLEINNGTAGTWRDLRLRNIEIVGTAATTGNATIGGNLLIGSDVQAARTSTKAVTWTDGAGGNVAFNIWGTLATTGNATVGGEFLVNEGNYDWIYAKLNTGLRIGWGQHIKFGDGTQGSSAWNVGLVWDASGRIRVSNGSTGKGDLALANLTASGTVTLGPFTFATLPSAAANPGAMCRITDRGQRIAYSDGTNWRFVSDDSIVS